MEFDRWGGNSGEGTGKRTTTCGPTLCQALHKRHISGSSQNPSQRITTVTPIHR